MIMTDEQFKNEVFHRRDEAVKRRKARRRVALSVIPVVCVFVLTVFLLDFIKPFEKSATLEDGTTDVAAKNTVTFSDGTEKELDSEAVEWLIANVTADVSAGETAVGNTRLPDDNADDYDETKSDSIIIAFSHEGEVKRLILNEKGLYYESTGRCIMPRSERLTEFIKMID